MSNKRLTPSGGALLLAVDTSSSIASYAVSHGETILASLTVNNDKPHSQTFFPAISTLLQLAEVESRQIDAFAVATGPGSFTGLRVGLAAVKGLAESLGRPCAGVNVFDLLALSTENIGLHLITIIAGKEDLFCGLRVVENNGDVRKLNEDVVCRSTQALILFEEELRSSNLTIVIDPSGISSELESYAEGLGNPAEKPRILKTRRDQINLAAILAIKASRELRAGMQQSAVAYYIRPSYAEIKKTAVL